MISKTLGSHFSYYFEDVIRIQERLIDPFPLKNNSLIFTSVNSVRAFFKSGFKPNEKFTDAHYNKIYAVGNKTKLELRRNGFGTFKVFTNAAEMSDFLIENANNESFLHFCGNLSLDILDQSLPLQNIKYKKIEVYTTEEINPKLNAHYDAIVFFSPSGVRSFVKYNSVEGAKLFTIGSTTEKELRKYTNQTIKFSTISSLKDLLQVMNKTLNAPEKL